MRIMANFTLLALLALSSAGCNALKPRIESSPEEVRQAIGVAFGLQPSATLKEVVEKIRSDVQNGSTPNQVTAYLGEAMKRSPVTASIKRTQRGQPITRNVTSREIITAYFIDNSRIFEVSILFIFSEDDRLIEVDATQGVWER